MLEASFFSELDLDEVLAREREASAFGERGRAAWNKRAAQRPARRQDSGYADAVLPRLDLTGVASVLDVGCGPGTLAVPLAQAGVRVVAVDFSEAMLARLAVNAEAAKVPPERLAVHRLAWADDWGDAVAPADLALCSRAMDFGDLRRCLRKLHRHARKRCALVLHTGGSYLGPDVLRLLDRPVHPRADYIYAVAMLHQMGICCSVEFIPSAGGTDYASADDFVEAVRWRMGELAAEDEAKLRTRYEELPVAAGGGRAYVHPFSWALLKWEVADTDPEAFARFARFDDAPAWRASAPASKMEVPQ